MRPIALTALVALALIAAALAAAGFRATREAHHYRVIQSLAHSIQCESRVVTTFDYFRKKRNIVGYERMGSVSSQEAGEMLTLAKKLRQDIEHWIRKCHPDLLE